MDNQMQIIRELIVEIDSASKGVATKYAQSDMESKLRAQMVEVFGKENPSYIEVSRNPNAGAFFAILEEFIGTSASVSLAEAIPYAEFRNVAWGDSITFEIENSDLFDVVTIANGNGNIRRQRIENGVVTVSTKAYGIKIFDNFKRFLAGRVNWSTMVSKVTASYVKHVKELVFTALYAAAPVNGNAAFNVNDGGAFAIQSVLDIVDHVQAETQSDVAIVGTRQALRKLAPVIATDEANRDMYQNGFYTTAEGYKLIPIDQMHVKNTFTFLLSNKTLLIVPMDSTGFVKVVEEGTPLITDKAIGENADMSVEYMFYREVGVAVVTGSKYGKYTWVS